MNIFNEIDRFFSSLYGYLTLNDSFLIFLGVFLFVILVTIISTSKSYEAKLIKAIDMFNNYFISNPQINEANLVSFNNRMKMSKVPKHLRKQWQQFVLYRDHPASYYMSFDICVSSPIKNSTFKRDITTMNIIAYILAIVSFLFNLYSVMATDLVSVLQQTLLCPIFILVLNYIVTIFLDIRHNAIVSDLNQNYQYFEVNMDKATQTLPEYVDYEVLFDRNEIKRGIPILYSYLQRRAEEEKKELERARLRNVEHEKFNFDEAGVESSLVLERAMQEAESYIAERKKFMQDMEQVNNDITQEEMNFREITKEYQRQMQVSKESFENFKTQLNEAASAIEANYLKKQQQQELDRQRNLERDYDTATDRHKKVLEGYQEELTAIENDIKAVRTNLEKGMMSEFDTYSSKVYKAAVKQAEESQSKKVKGLQDKIKELETKLANADSELSNIKSQQPNQQQDNQTTDNGQVDNQVAEQVQPIINNESQEYYNPEDGQAETTEVENTQDNNSENSYNNSLEDSQVENNGYQEESYDTKQELESTENEQNEYSSQNDNEQPFTFNYLDEDNQSEQPTSEDDTMSLEEGQDDNNEGIANETNNLDNNEPIAKDGEAIGEPFDTVQSESINQKKRPGRPRKEKVEKEHRPVGRPKKVVSEEVTSEKRKVGRPKKETNVDASSETEKKKVGRPRKETNLADESTTEKKKVGRPKKVVDENAEANLPKRGRGRPKKVIENPQESIEEYDVKPTIDSSVEPTVNEVDNQLEAENQVETQSDLDENKAKEPTVKKRGRPKKVVEKTEAEPVKEDVEIPNEEEGDNVEDIDAYLKKIDEQIAEENAKIAESEKQLEKKSRISRRTTKK